MKTTPQTFLRFIAGAAAAAAVLFLVWYFSSIVVYILISAVLAVMGNPLVRRLSAVHVRGWRIPRWLAAFAALVVIQLFIPIRGFTPFAVLGDIADVIVILYLLLIPAIATIMGGAASGSPYAGVGLSREMVTIISCELPLVLVLLAIGKTVGDAMGTGLTFSMTKIAEYQIHNGSLILHPSMIPAAIAFLMTIPGETGNHPFDAAEAETEICEGLLAEYSGAPLGIFKLSHAVKMLTLTSMFVALFLGGIGTGLLVVDGIIVFALCVVLTAVSISFVHAVTARLKIEQIFKYYWTVVTGLALISLVLAWYGL